MGLRGGGQTGRMIQIQSLILKLNVHIQRIRTEYTSGNISRIRTQGGTFLHRALDTCPMQSQNRVMGVWWSCSHRRTVRLSVLGHHVLHQRVKVTRSQISPLRLRLTTEQLVYTSFCLIHFMTNLLNRKSRSPCVTSSQPMAITGIQLRIPRGEFASSVIMSDPPTPITKIRKPLVFVRNPKIFHQHRCFPKPESLR